MATVAVPDSASQRSDAEDSLLLPFDVAKYDGAAVNEGSEDGDEPPVKKPNILRRYPKTFIALAVLVVLVILILTVVIPLATSAIVSRYVEEASIQMDELEILDVLDQVANIHLKSVMHIEPVLISLTGETLPTSFDMLISDPEEGGRMGVIGSLAIPRLYEEGFVVYIDVVTQMRIRSERLFNLLLTQALAEETVTIVLEGDLTIAVDLPLYSTLSGTGHLREAASFRGLGGLTFHVESLRLSNTTSNAAVLPLRVYMNNTSQFFTAAPLPVYYANLDVTYNGEHFGQVFLGALVLSKGTSYSDLALLAVRTAENADAVTHFFSDYVMKQAGVLVVNGTVKVDLGFEMSQGGGTALAFTLALPYSSASPLVASIHSNATVVADPDYTPLRMDAVAAAANPFEFAVQINELAYDLFVEPVSGGCNRTVSRVVVRTAVQLVGSDWLCIATPFAVSEVDAECIGSAISAGRLEVAVSAGQAILALGAFEVPIAFSQSPLVVDQNECMS